MSVLFIFKTLATFPKWSFKIALAGIVFFILPASILGQTDLALNKPATASSVQKEGNPNDYKPSYAFDGNLGTRWGSDYKDSQWVYVDLEKTYQITKVVLNWEDANPNTYRIDVSIDKLDWDTLARMKNMPIGERVDTVTGSKPGRYVRVFCEKRNQSKLYLPLVEYNGISLYAFRVYGTAVTTGIISSAKKSGYLLGRPKGMVISDPRQMQYGLDGKAKRTKQKPIKTLSPNSKNHTLSQ